MPYSTRRRQHLILGRANLSLPGLEYDGEKLRCGLCRRRYILLAHHIRQTHSWTPDDYREEFSLNRTQPLCTPQYSDNAAKRLRDRGLVGKYPNYDLNKGVGVRHRDQAKLNLSHEHQKPIKMTLSKLAAQSKNGKKAWRLVPCSRCGKLTLGLRTTKRAFVCKDCKPIRDREYQYEWQRRNPEKCGLYQKRYRDKREKRSAETAFRGER